MTAGWVLACPHDRVNQVFYPDDPTGCMQVSRGWAEQAPLLSELSHGRVQCIPSLLNAVTAVVHKACIAVLAAGCKYGSTNHSRAMVMPAAGCRQ